MARVESQVAESCPAFKEGCPFQQLPTLLGSMERCAAFKEGCPFKMEDSVESLYNKLAEMPASHRLGGSSGASQAVQVVLQTVHERSKTLKAELKTQCPVFATSCPFKTVTSDGQPLVQELDAVAWGLETEEECRRPALSEPLSKSLKSGTKTVHRAAENVRFVRDFLAGAVPQSSYVALLRSLAHVYGALERALEALPVQYKHCDFASLRRTEPLLADLRWHLGLAGNAELDLGLPSAAARQYVERVEKLQAERPLLLLAHAYTRYMGDLSGGQILAKAAAKSYKLEQGQGTAFYRFEEIGEGAELKAFKRSYRASLDELQLSAEDADAMVEEANAAFLMNMLLFEERDVAAGHLARVRTLEEVQALVKANSSALNFQRAYASQCPFLPKAQAQARLCPWPFVWLHDPKSALVRHPGKNFVGLLVMVLMVRLAKRFPKSTTAVLGVLALATRLRKPKSH